MGCGQYQVAVAVNVAALVHRIAAPEHEYQTITTSVQFADDAIGKTFPAFALMGASPSPLNREHSIEQQHPLVGPVLQIVRSASVAEAIKLPSQHQYGNGVAIFTRNGQAAREFAQQVNVGMVGINVPIPVPVAYHSFGGWKRSAFGDANQHGTEGVRFYSKIKTVTQRWPEGDLADPTFVIPTMQ